ncbi:MAG: histidine kinase [Anaerolineales bacterium]
MADILRSRLHWRGLTMQLFLLLVLPLTVVGLLVIFVSLNLHENAMRTLVGERDQLAIRAAANALAEQLAHRSTTLQSLALRVVETDDFDEILASSSFLLSDFDAGLAVFSREGTLLASSNQPSLWEQFHEGGDSELGPHLDNTLTRPQFLAVGYDAERGVFVIPAIASASKQSPIVAGLFTLSFARQTLDAFSSGEQSNYILFDQTGQPILQSNGASIEQVDTSMRLALAGEIGSVFLEFDGQEDVVAYSPVMPPGWALIIAEPWESVSSPLLRSTQAAPLLLVPVVLFAFLALWFEARQIVQPLKALRGQAAALSWGDYEMINKPVGGIEEIKRLQQELVHLSDKVQKAQMGLHNYIGAITAGQEEERKRLSNELHDETIQSLIALNQRVQLAQLSSLEPGTTRHLAEIQTLVEQTIGNLRGLVRAMRPPYLEDLGLSASLNMLSREASQTYKLPVAFRLTGKEIRLSPDVELAFYRIAQEGLSNISRHSKAKHAWVELGFFPNMVTLTLRDDGVGFRAPESPAEFAPGGHFGLLGIYEKSQRIGANFEIHSKPNRGTELKVSLMP